MTEEKKLSTKKIIGIVCIVGVVLIILILALSGGDSTTSTPETTINVTDLKITSQGYGMYEITCNLVPDQDYSYLEMAVIWYDADGAILDKSSLAWFMSDIKQGKTIKVTGEGYLTGSGSPAKAEVYFFDESFTGDTEGYIYKQTIDL